MAPRKEGLTTLMERKSVGNPEHLGHRRSVAKPRDWMQKTTSISGRFFSLRRSSVSRRRDYISDEYRFVRRMDRRLLGGRALNVLDLGCGKGKLDTMLSAHYFVTGIDKNRKAVREAKLNAKKARFVTADMRRLNLPERFDIIVSADAIDHGHDLRKAFGSILKTAKGHLSKNGIIIFDITFLRELWERDSTHTDTVSSGGTRYIRVFTRSVEGDSGRFDDTFVRSGARGTSAESYHYISRRLIGLADVVGTLKRLGFKVIIYDGWSDLPFKATSQNSPVFVAVKR